VHAAALRVRRHGDGHVAHVELVDFFHAEVGEARHLGTLDGLGRQVGGAAHRHQVGAVVLADRFDRNRPALGLADHRDQAGCAEHHQGELVHPRGGGRAGGADHFVAHRLQALSANLLAPPDGQVTDIASLQETLRRSAQANAASVAKVNLIIGFGYDPATLEEQRHPTRDELDAVSKDVPIAIVHQSGRLSAVNSKALEAAGVTAASQDPPGGVIRRRAGCLEPGGVLEENASSAVLMKLLGNLGAEGLKTVAREGAKLWASFGYTPAEDGRASPGVTKVLQQVAAEGGIAIDVMVYAYILIDREFIKANQSKAYVNRVRVAGAKLSLDGSPQGFTAWRDRPYYKPVGSYPPGHSGYAAVTAEQAFDAILWASENGVQVLAHANSERASDLLLAAPVARGASSGPSTGSTRSPGSRR
jgi:hypothetical protein